MIVKRIWMVEGLLVLAALMTVGAVLLTRSTENGQRIPSYTESGQVFPDEADGQQCDDAVEICTNKPDMHLADRKPAEIAQDLLERISDAIDGKLEEQDLLAIAVLRDEDLDLAKLLKDEYFAPTSGRAVDVVRNSVILKALEYLNTPQARKTIIEIACTEQPNAGTLGPRAVRALTGITVDADEIALVLGAPHPATRAAAVDAMANRSLSVEAISTLAAQMSSPSWAIQSGIARAFSTDTSGVNAALKVQAIIENYQKLREIVDNKEAVPWNVYLTPEEMARGSYIRVLADMRDGEAELKFRLAEASGAERELLLLASGRRGIEAVRPELLNMAGSAEDGFARTQAVYALYHIATDEDKPFLRWLADNDPFERAVDGTDSIFPVRYAARQVLGQMERE